MPDPGIVDDPALRERPRVFADRTHAGDVLADLLSDLCVDRVLAIPSGGVAVAVELARVLHRPLDVAVVGKITLPSDRDTVCGAVAWDGRTLIDRALVTRAAVTVEELDARIERARERLARRMRRFRPGGPPDLSGESVLLVDDGLSTASTLSIAVEAARGAGARAVSVAVPTALRSSAQRLSVSLDGLYVANLRRGPHFTVAEAYRSWEDVSEDEALALVEAVRRAGAPGGSGRTSRSPA